MQSSVSPFASAGASSLERFSLTRHAFAVSRLLIANSYGTQPFPPNDAGVTVEESAQTERIRFHGRFPVKHRVNDRQRGGSRVSLVIALLIVGAMVFAAVKIVPVYVNAYELQDSMQSEARFALSYPPKDANQIRTDVWQKAQDLSIPLATKDEIQVIENQGTVNISIDYSVPVDLKVYQLTLQFHPHADNHTI